MALRKVVVFIYLPGKTTGVPAGIFTYDEEMRLGSYAYGRKYIERENAVSVDPMALPIGGPLREISINDGLYGAFRDSAPDYWGRLVISAETQKPPEAFSEVDFLLAANATRTGNLDFRSSLEDPEPELAPPHFNRLEEIMDGIEKLEVREKIDQHILRLIRQGSSVGGARPKCTVAWEDSLWIAKFAAGNDTLNIPRIEYAAMTLARLCGISVPEMRIESVGTKDVFLIRRFDREKNEKGWLRRGFLSSLSFMQWDERDRHLWDYPSIADNMRRYMASPFIHELFRRMVFNILIRNTDDHPRNHGFVVDEEKISLSPAYDIVPSPTRSGVGTDFRLAMSIGDQGREANLENALSRAPRFGLSNQEAGAIIEELIEKTGSWGGHFRDHGVSDRDLNHLKACFYTSK